jgi:hypothetical protein
MNTSEQTAYAPLTAEAITKSVRARMRFRWLFSRLKHVARESAEETLAVLAGVDRTWVSAWNSAWSDRTPFLIHGAAADIRGQFYSEYNRTHHYPGRKRKLSAGFSRYTFYPNFKGLIRDGAVQAMSDRSFVSSIHAVNAPVAFMLLAIGVSRDDVAFIAAAGANFARVPALQRQGFDLDEAVRIAMHEIDDSLLTSLTSEHQWW